MKLSKLLGRGGRSSEPSTPSDPTDRPRRSPAVEAFRGTPVDLPRADVAAAEALAAEGRLVEAVDALAAANRTERHSLVELRLIELRYLAAARTVPGPGRAEWPPVYADPFPDVVGRLPEIPASELSTEVLGGAVAHHGCLIVRGVFSPEQVARSVEAIERTHLRYRTEVEAAAAAEGTEPPLDFPGVAVDLSEPLDDAWYHPLRLPGVPGAEGLRRMVAQQGGTWLADSPSSAAVVLEGLRDCGAHAAIEGHLGERPVFSMQKSTLRRSLPKPHKNVAWHQDGSFLATDVRTMNVWVALSPCGGDRPSPGMEVLPRRVEEILPVDGVMSPHSISYDLVAELAAEMPTIVPEFDPGDGMLFDERFLHRSYLSATMTDIRYALECWFFAPSHQEPGYTPLLA